MARFRMRAVVCAGFAVWVLAACVAWAATATLSVTDQSGRGVPGATVTLYESDGETAAKGTTDESGNVTFDGVAAGSYFYGISRRGVQEVRGTVTLTDGQTTRLSVPTTAAPLRRRGSPIAGIAARMADVDDMDFTRVDDQRTTTINGVPTTQTFPVDLADQNARFVNDFEETHVEYVRVELPVLSWITNNRMDAFDVNIVAAVGHLSATLGYQDLQTASNSREYDGSGTTWTFGVGSTVQLCEMCPWHVDADYSLVYLGDIQLDRDPPSAVNNGVIVKDDATFSQQIHMFTTTLVFARQWWAPYAGIGGTFRTATLEGDVVADFSAAAGFPVQQQIVFRNDFESNVVQFIAGVDLALPNVPLTFRGGVAVGGDETSIVVGVGYDFSDLFR